MILNPLRTLAGRLMLVTVAAVALTQIAAFGIFANERGNALRRAAEARLAERFIGVYQRLSADPRDDRRQALFAAGDRMMRFMIVDEPMEDPGGGGRVAQVVTQVLTGVEVRVSARVTERPWFGERRAPQREGEDTGPRHERRPDTPTEAHAAATHNALNQQLTRVTIDAALGDGQWLRAEAALPGPGPAPWRLWMSMLASMLTVGLGAIWVSGQIGRPLAGLARAAERFGQGELNAVAPENGPQDVARASRAFNDMTQRLGRQLQRQRQMLWALSHDLRTPITALRLRAELIEDTAQRERLLGPLQEIETLSENALALARAGASSEERQDIDIAEIALTVSADFEGEDAPRAFEATAPVLARCRPDEVARAVRNLADNAAKYAEHWSIHVYRNADGEGVIEVRDDGPGVPDDDIERLTEPFFRSDAARSNGSGVGLGLAIVQAIADSHGGRLELSNLTPRGFSAQFILPG